MTTFEKQAIKKKQALANLEVVLTLSQEEAKKLKEYERDVLEL